MNETKCKKRDLDPAALSIEIRPDPAGEGPSTISIRHPTAPFCDIVSKDDHSKIQGLINDYLKQLLDCQYRLNKEKSGKLELLKSWWPSLEQWLKSKIEVERLTEKCNNVNLDGNRQLAWLPIEDPNTPSQDREKSVVPFSSFWFQRNSQQSESESTLVMSAAVVSVAVGSALTKGANTLKVCPRGFGIGIRVVAHVRPLNRALAEFRITSMSASLPARGANEPVGNMAMQPHDDYPSNLDIDTIPFRESSDQNALILPRVTHSQSGKYTQENKRNHAPEYKQDPLYEARIFQQDPMSQAPKNMGGSPHKLRSRRPTGTEETLALYLSDEAPVIQRVRAKRPEIEPVLLSVIQAPLVSNDPPLLEEIKTYDLRLISVDRSSGPLSRHRSSVLIAFQGDTLFISVVDASGRTVLDETINDSASGGEVTAFRHRLNAYHREPRTQQKNTKPDIIKKALSLAGYTDIKSVPPAVRDIPLRSDGLSAVHGLINLGQLFERLLRYAIKPERYFRSAELPLDVHYRSGMPYGPGKNGQTVNAAVQPVGWRRHQIAPDHTQDPPRLALRLALANLSHRGRKKWQGDKPSPAEPLGIGADPRWMWHEIGHVLLMATTGELEMRFAHSPGDALAAIVSDPKSHLASDDKRHRWRGATFPWVFIPRRHDRSVKHGWSWSGAMHRPLRELPDSKQPRRKGYRSEQILSTSLFRLYLCLGGDTTKGNRAKRDEEQRQAAADYTLFLIIKGLGLLGDARIVPANDPDQLVAALIDADIGTEKFKLVEQVSERIGGCAHKAIRWAFEAQGLYADDVTTNNNIGKPPEVDIYIEDQRPEIEEWLDCSVRHRPGSYVPVSLGTPSSGDENLPKWFADDSAIEVKNGNIHVTVRNRGIEAAENVRVKVYRSRWPEGSSPADWREPNRWEKLGETPAKNVGGRTEKRLDPNEEFVVDTKEQWDNGPYLILAQATCSADPANIDETTGLPCSRKPTPLVDLVANDNNLGLKEWRPTSIAEKAE